MTARSGFESERRLQKWLHVTMVHDAAQRESLQYNQWQQPVIVGRLWHQWTELIIT